VVGADYNHKFGGGFGGEMIVAMGSHWARIDIASMG